MSGRSLLPGLNLRASISVPTSGSLIASQRVLTPVIRPVFQKDEQALGNEVVAYVLAGEACGIGKKAVICNLCVAFLA